MSVSYLKMFHFILLKLTRSLIPRHSRQLLGLGFTFKVHMYEEFGTSVLLAASKRSHLITFQGCNKVPNLVTRDFWPGTSNATVGFLTRFFNPNVVNIFCSAANGFFGPHLGSVFGLVF